MATVAGAIGRSEGQREKRYSHISASAHRRHPSCSLCCSVLFAESTYLSIAPAVAASPSPKSIVVRPSLQLTTQRPSSSCITTVALAPTSSGTFLTPSAADDSFYTYSLAPSLLQLLLLCSLYREHLYGPPPIVPRYSAKRAQQVLSRYQMIANIRPQRFSRCPSDLSIAPATSAIYFAEINRR
ncbi:hypothetical protein GW17_00016380 [Ensete ventricosum]|nr:hypothetical protein GW17_00016380 [Ensete ventricosum]